MKTWKGTRKTAAALTILALALAGMSKQDTPQDSDAAEKTAEITRGEAGITEEMTSRRTKFTKQYALSDGSFLANSYSMPVHYKKGGTWREIDTTLVKSGKKKYKTRSTGLRITAARKANKKAEITLKRGSYKLSFALQGKKVKAKKAKIQNPQKKDQTDILNSNQIQYKNAYQNQTLVYEIYPEKIVEKISVKKRSAAKKIKIRINGGKQKIKIKNNRIYFKTKKGKTKYTRLKTIVTDAKGVSTSKVKVTYDKKTKTATIKPDKKWLKSKKRKFPLSFRTAYTTSEHERDVKIGAAYAGAPDSNYTYNESLLLQAGKCTAFTQTGTLAEMGNPDVRVRDARLYVENEKTIKMGAGKTFQTGVHKVTEKWSGKKVTNNKRPSYEPQSSATLSMQKKGTYSCDVTELVKAWYQGEPNYGVALAAGNQNGACQTKIGKNPYFSIHYEITGFDGAVELKEGEDITRDVFAAGQENYYYFDAKPGIAYDLYTSSTLDTQGILYDSEKNRLEYDDNSGQGDNFSFIKSYDGRRYLKVVTKGNAAGQYTLTLKKRFAIPEPAGIRGTDRYTITWNAVENAKEYLVCIYDGGTKISEAVVTGTSYDYIYSSGTAGKTLGFTVTARENAALTGEPSRMVFNTSGQSEWVYAAPMQEGRKNAAAAASGKKVYVLGGENAAGPLKSFAAYDTEKKTWEALPDYPGTDTGICRPVMFAYHNEIYVVGGQTDTSASAKILNTVYAYNTETRQWQKKADMAEGRTNPAGAASTAAGRDELYLWTRAGATNKAQVYHIKTDTWETAVMPDTSTVIDAASVDGRIFVLKEDGETMYWQEYLPEDNAFEDNAVNGMGAACPFASSDKYRASAVIRGKIYMVKEEETREVLAYDAYTDEWSRVSDMNLSKKDSALAATENELYSIGGEMAGFGVLDVVEQYTVKVQSTTKEMSVEKGEAYELQVAAGNLKKGQTKTVAVTVDPNEMQILNASSFEEEEELRKGADGTTLLKYQPKKGVVVFQLAGSLERGESHEAYQSIPVEAKVDGKTKVEITLTEK
ncbi:MAG: DNRLRE domain-containing protein [Lachnospiraceae bacterium]|nr:DNRLRE domain-containing protein [Lachnospiraceae bacterium]